MLLNVVRLLVHIVLPTRKPLYKYLNSIESNYKNLDILEIGSGDVRKINLYHIFHSVIYTNRYSELGHKFLDITGSELKKSMT